MNPVFETLEKHGFINENHLPDLLEQPGRQAVKLYEDLYGSVNAQQYGLHEDAAASQSFRFLASAAFRGDTGCGALPCRAGKVDFMGHFAGLYADQVLVPLPLEAPEKVKAVRKAKDLLADTALSLFLLRPLIETGIIKPVVMKSQHCEHTIQWVNEMVSVVHDVADSAAADEMRKFKVTYQLPEHSPTRRSTVYVVGPETYLEHGEIVVLFDEPANWRPKNWKFDRSGKVRLAGPRKRWFIERIFNEIANDTTFYLAYGRFQNSRYLYEHARRSFALAVDD